MGQLFSTGKQPSLNNRTATYNNNAGNSNNEYLKLAAEAKAREQQQAKKEKDERSKQEQLGYTQYSSLYNYTSSSSNVTKSSLAHDSFYTSNASSSAVSSYNSSLPTRTYPQTKHDIAKTAVEEYKTRSTMASSCSSVTQPTITTTIANKTYCDVSKKIMPMFDSTYKTNASSTLGRADRIDPAYDIHSETEPSSSMQRKMYGYYECDCGAWWESAHSWADETQDCKSCGNQVFPYEQEELKHKDPDENSVNKPHMEDLCGMCQKLGMSCTIFMEIAQPPKNKPKSSYHVHQKPDVRVKGLPNDITEEKLRKMFARYGDISRVHILKQDPRFSTRVAFITFDDPEAVVDQFNSVKQSAPKAHRRLLLT